MSRVPTSAARALLTVLVMTGALAAGVAFAGASVGSVNFTLGDKRLTSDWYVGSPKTGAPGDTLPTGRPGQYALGLELTGGRAGWPVLVALDVLHSYDDGLQRFPFISLGPLVIPPANVRRRARTLEIGLGVRRSLLVLGLSPYLGAGASWVRGSVIYEMSNPSQGQFGAPGTVLGGHDSAIGFWVGGGIYRRLGSRLQMGVGGRYSKATLQLPESTVRGANGGYYFTGKPTDRDAGGRHIGLLVGWSFPSRK